jgi:hypothetical protein
MRVTEKPIVSYPWYLRPFFWNQKRKYGQILKPALIWARVPRLFAAIAAHHLADRLVLQHALVSGCGSEFCLAVGDTPCPHAANAVSDRAGVAKSECGLDRGWIYTADGPGTEKSHPSPPSKEGLN